MEGELDAAELVARLKDVRARAYKLAIKRVSADEAEDVAQKVTESIGKKIGYRLEQAASQAAQKVM